MLSPWQGGAVRETQEEVGAPIEPGPLLAVYNLPGRGLHSSTSQLNLSHFRSLKPRPASTFSSSSDVFLVEACQRMG